MESAPNITPASAETAEAVTPVTPVADTPKPAVKKRDTWLLVIAIFKLTKGVLLLIVGIGALTLIHKDVADTVAEWVRVLRVDPDNRFIHKVLLKLGVMDARKMEELSLGTFFYSAILLTEGIGLLLRKHWAEYFTIIATASFIPLELMEIFKRVTFTRIGLLIVNSAVLWYLIARIRRRKEAET